MANTIMTSVYNHYMTTYSPKKSDARLDSHKKSELKDIYSTILKLNKEAPLCILDRSKETKSFAVSLKENARQLQHTILQTGGNTEDNFLNNQIAYSSNENILSAKYVGEQADASDIPSYNIEVKQLAKPQVNVGNFLPSFERTIAPGNYSFDVMINGAGYEFQFGITEADNNIDIQNKLARLINHSNIGLTASVTEEINDTSSLRIASVKTGEPVPPDTPIFSISDNETSRQTGSVKYLGIDYISDFACDAQFVINGEESQASSNHFTIDKSYELTLHSISDETVNIGIKPNTESLKDNIRNLISGYNTFLKSMDEFQGLYANNSKFTRELNGITKLYTNELDTIGITREADGVLSIDENLLSQAAETENAKDMFAPLKDFSVALFKKSEYISFDPLNYSNKTIVAYKNPGKNFPSPYASSAYSGLLFNYYC